jgi:hypothetical protein
MQKRATYRAKRVLKTNKLSTITTALSPVPEEKEEHSSVITNARETVDNIMTDSNTPLESQLKHQQEFLQQYKSELSSNVCQQCQCSRQTSTLFFTNKFLTAPMGYYCSVCVKMLTEQDSCYRSSSTASNFWTWYFGRVEL